MAGNTHARCLIKELWCVVIVLVAVAAAVVAAERQSDRDATRASATARLSGVIVTDDQIPSPVRGATVTLTEVAGRFSGRTVETDENGAFEFAGLPAGDYDVSAVKPAYLKASYGATRPERAGTPIALADGQQVTTLTLRMWRGAVITGALLDPKSHPLPGATVQVRRFQFVNGVRRMATATSGSTTTDDRGIYRIFGLPPGEYAVLAAVTGAGRGSVSPPPAFGYAPVYFPGTTVALDAVPVRLNTGDERSGVDFAAQLVVAANVSGTIAPPDGHTIASVDVSAVLTARSESSGLVVARSASIAADGKFTIEGVTPGQYVLTVRGTPRRTDANGPPRLGWWASASVWVDGRDVSSGLITLEPGVTVAGRVIFNGASPPTDATAGVNVRLTPAHGDQGAADVRTAVVTPEHTFTIVGVVPGEYLLSASLIARGTPAAGWTFRSASVEGRDVTDLPLVIAAGTEPDNLMVSFSNRSTEISGLLQDASGRPAPEYFIVVLPANRALWAAGLRRIQQVRPATDGRFTITGLPAGDYALAATTDVQPSDLLDPAFLDQLLAASLVRLSLEEGAKVAQDIRVAGKEMAIPAALRSGG